MPVCCLFASPATLPPSKPAPPPLPPQRQPRQSERRRVRPPPPPPRPPRHKRRATPCSVGGPRPALGRPRDSHRCARSRPPSLPPLGHPVPTPSHDLDRGRSRVVRVTRARQHVRACEAHTESTSSVGVLRLRGSDGRKNRGRECRPIGVLHPSTRRGGSGRGRNGIRGRRRPGLPPGCQRVRTFFLSAMITPSQSHVRSLPYGPIPRVSRYDPCRAVSPRR